MKRERRFNSTHLVGLVEQHGNVDDVTALLNIFLNDPHAVLQAAICARTCSDGRALIRTVRDAAAR